MHPRPRVLLDKIVISVTRKTSKKEETSSVFFDGEQKEQMANSDMTDMPTESRHEDSDRKKRRRGIGEAVICRPLEVVVRDDRVEQAIRQLKNRMAREGVLRELKNRRHYFKPSELKRIKSREAARRRRKQARQKGFH